MDGIHDLDDGEAALRVEARVPKVLEEGAHVRVLDRPVVGEEHRDQPGVGGALHVVLAAQRMESGALPSDLARQEGERDEATGVVGAVHVLADAHAPEDDRSLGARIEARHLAQRLGRDAADGGHLVGREILHVVREPLEILRVRLDVLTVVELFRDDRVHHGVQHGDVAAGPELQHVRRVPLQRLAARVHDDQLGAALHGLLEEGRGDRMVLVRVGADHHDDVGVLHSRERRRHRARADALHQRGDRGGVAQARAVVDVVGSKARAHQLLEQVGLLVRALGRAESGERVAAPGVANAPQALRRAVERLLPGGLAEMREGIGGVDVDVVLAHAIAPDERHGQPVGVVDVVEAEAALHTQAVAVGRAVATLDSDDTVVLDLVGELAADPAIRADAVDLALGRVGKDAVLVHQGLGHQRAGGTGLDALPAGDAGRGPHRVVEVEHDLLEVAARGHADDVVDLHLAAGPDAEIALDTGVELDRHRGVAEIVGFVGPIEGRETAREDIDALGPVPEPGPRIVRDVPPRLVRDEELEHEPLRGPGPRGGRVHRHPGAGLAHARGGEDPLALDLDHARAAIAVGTVAGLLRMAQVRDLAAMAAGDLPDRLARPGLDLVAVELKADGLGHRPTFRVSFNTGRDR